ncbi:DUF551 domain-containing protein [Serratia ureilytica]|uniref:DUF551 domain-containing protein n=1 Tax=Serratia ureilytica TaxID=300181 RepID=UPI00384EA6AF
MDVGFMRPLLVWRGYWIDGDDVTSEWIKCEEQLPQQNEEVLVFGESWGTVVAFINHHGNWDDGDFYADISGITHWMPLPEPPAD